MKEIHIVYYSSPVGEILLGAYDGRLCLADWKERKDREKIDRRLQKALCAVYVEHTSELLNETIKQLDAYFSKKSQTFTLPLLTCGTDFQKEVWEGLMHIPYGQTVSYLDLAKSIGKEKAVRAVSTAIGANALSLFIPCHRIIGSNGSLTGYAGGLDAKQFLLSLEK